MKPKLLVIELWGLGDLVLVMPFLRAATEKFAVTLAAKAYALDLQPRFFPGVEILPLNAPWTAFRRKYWLHTWRWGELWRLRQELRQRHYDFGVSGRWDPRDHFLLWQTGARERFGFPRLASQVFLTHPLILPDRSAHRRQNWRVAGQALGLDVAAAENGLRHPPSHGYVLVHSGASQLVKTWPLERFQGLVGRLRAKGLPVRLACDGNQRAWWLQAGEPDVVTPRSVTELLALTDGARQFIGNDSGPGHVAAACGVPTFTIFGPAIPEWFAPAYPQAVWIEGKPCPHKPCFDNCRLPEPVCILGLSEEEVWARVERFVNQPD